METQNKKITWLYKPVLKILHAEASAKAPLETGGVLMGYFSQPGNIPVILWATGPGSKSIHHQNYYCPDYKFDELLISEIYKKSKQKITYLGDWHTHPVSSSSLSFRDKRTLRRIAKFKPARVETPLMLILSYDGQWAETVWQAKLHKTCKWYNRVAFTKLTAQSFE